MSGENSEGQFPDLDNWASYCQAEAAFNGINETSLRIYDKIEGYLAKLATTPDIDSKPEK